MATTTSDKRQVRVAVTRAEMSNLLGTQANAAGFIDFTPDSTEIFDNGTAGFEIVFEVATPAP